MPNQSHASSISREPAGAGGVPSILALKMIADPSGEGHTFAAAGTEAGSFVANPTEGFDATLDNFARDARLLCVRSSTFAY